MAKRKIGKPYRGILTVPMPKYDPNLSDSQNCLIWKTSALQKLEALVDHYSLMDVIKDGDNESKWMFLALHLARDHIPAAFAPQPLKPPQGKKPQYTGDHDLELFGELARAKDKGQTVAERAGHLIKNHPRFKGKNPGTLLDRYYKLQHVKSPEGKRLAVYLVHYCAWLAKLEGRKIEPSVTAELIDKIEREKL